MIYEASVVKIDLYYTNRNELNVLPQLMDLIEVFLTG
jgi:hypothetical protein